MNPEDYSKYLTENITKDYKKAAKGTTAKINAEAATIASGLELDDRIEALAERKAFITMKDHKEDFESNPKFRLINPCKTNLGRVSKCILQDHIETIKAKTGLNLMKNTAGVLKWFKSIQCSDRAKFIKFDIETYYPSISEELLAKAIEFARGYTPISDEAERIIQHCRRSVLIDEKGEAWEKKENPKFDVTIGSYDGAEISELCGLYLLSRLRLLEAEQGGECILYRDDGLMIVEGNGQQVDRTRKKLVKLFKDENLKITTETNITVVSYLDVVMDLKDKSTKPFIKSNANTRYVSKLSNHPKNVTDNIPEAVNKRLCDISSSRVMFEQEVQHYQEALRQAGYSDQLGFKEARSEEDHTSQRRKNRRRKVIWFNPPYSENVSTKVGKIFLQLIKKHFPPESPLHKLFNSQNMRISYSCFPNMHSIISAHNKNILEPRRETSDFGCNCMTGPDTCPLQANCLIPNLVYKAVVNSTEGPRTYFGQTTVTFKKRWNIHKSNFRTGAKNTYLASYVLSLKNKNLDYSIAWSVASTPQPYKRGGKECDLCLTEKTLIAKNMSRTSINRRTEILNKCRHKEGHTLNNFYCGGMLAPMRALTSGAPPGPGAPAGPSAGDPDPGGSGVGPGRAESETDSAVPGAAPGPGPGAPAGPPAGDPDPGGSGGGPGGAESEADGAVPGAAAGVGLEGAEQSARMEGGGPALGREGPVASGEVPDGAGQGGDVPGAGHGAQGEGGDLGQGPGVRGEDGDLGQRRAGPVTRRMAKRRKIFEDRSSNSSLNIHA